jgi:hypothetical protein
MCSNLRRFSASSIAFALSATLLISACRWEPLKNLRTGDQSPPPGSLQLNLGKFSCMSEVGKKVDAYLGGEMSELDIRTFMGCIRGALAKFTSIEKGETQGSYTPDELTRFLNRYYLRDEVLTPAFATEIMKVKVLILGGDEYKITEQEIAGLSNLVTFFENEAVANLQYIPIYTASKSLDTSKLTTADFVNMSTQLQESALQLAKKLSTQNVGYELNSLNSFLTELRKFLRWDEYRPESQTPEQTVKIVAAYKAVVTGKNDSVIHPNEWAPLSDSVSSLFSIYVNYKLQLKDKSISSGQGLDALVNAVSSATSLFGRIIDRNSTKAVTFAASDDLIDAFVQTNIMPGNLRASSIKQAYKFLIQKAFRSRVKTLGSSPVNGLGWQALNEIHSEFELWADGQRYLNDNAIRALRIQPGTKDWLKDIGATIQGFDFRQFIFNGVDLGDARSTEIERIAEKIPPYFRVDDARAYILPTDEMNQAGVFNSVADLTRMNTIRALIRLLVRGAATDDRVILMSRDWIHSGVTEDEMQTFFDNLHDLGVDLKLIDPRKENSGRRSFDEGKLFTYDGNGINEPDGQGSELLNVIQGIEYLTTIWSGGRVRDMVYKHIDAMCKSQGVLPGPPDVFGIAKINRKCFEQNFFADGLNDFVNLPHLRDDFNKRTASEKTQIIKALEVIAKSPCPDVNYIELGEIANVATVLHYVEVIFTVYDKDRTGSLTGQEAMRAFKRFSGYIGRQAEQLEGKKISVSLLKAVYSYLVQHQELPSGWGDVPVLYEKVRYFNEDINQYEDGSSDSAPEMNIDRVKLLEVLEVLATSNSKPPTSANVCSPSN